MKSLTWVKFNLCLFHAKQQSSSGSLFFSLNFRVWSFCTQQKENLQAWTEKKKTHEWKFILLLLHKSFENDAIRHSFASRRSFAFTVCSGLLCFLVLFHCIIHSEIHSMYVTKERERDFIFICLSSSHTQKRTLHSLWITFSDENCK